MKPSTAALLFFLGTGQFSQQALAQACDWTGVWDTTYSELTIYQSGRYVTGIYPGWDSGRIEGTLSSDGTLLDGFWFESPSYAPPRDTGPLEFEIASDCNSFTGRWAYDNSDGFIGNWSGTRTGPVPEAEADALAQVSGAGVTVDNVPVGDNGVAPLQQDEERALQAPPDNYRQVRLRTRCEAFENPAFAIIEDLSPGSPEIPEGKGMSLVVKIVIDRVQACEDLGLGPLPLISGPARTIVELQAEDGVTRISNLLAVFGTHVSTPLLSFALNNQSGVIVGHDAKAGRSTVWAVDTPITVVPADPDLPNLTLAPDQLVVLDASGVGQPVTAPLFQSTFE